MASNGHTVVRLKGGDPALFARTCEETDALTKANIPFAIVPGITAASGCQPIRGSLYPQARAQSVSFMTAHFKDADQWPENGTHGAKCIEANHGGLYGAKPT